MSQLLLLATSRFVIPFLGQICADVTAVNVSKQICVEKVQMSRISLPREQAWDFERDTLKHENTT